MKHDQNFKNLILDYLRPALDFFAKPEAAAIPADARILPVRQEQLQQRLGDRFHELDTPLLAEWRNGREAVVFILEEESDPRRFSIHRLAHYCVDLAELLKTDRVVPVVTFLKPGRYPQKLTLTGGQRVYLQFSYLICDLGRLPVDEYLESRNVVSRILLPLMNYPRERRVEVCLRALEGLVALEPNWDKGLKYSDFIVQYGKLKPSERAELERGLAQKTSREVAMRLFQEARDEARREGFQQGRQEGLLEAIQLGLEIKFGEAGLALLPEIQQIQDVDLIRTIKDALRTAASPDDIRRLYQDSLLSH